MSDTSSSSSQKIITSFFVSTQCLRLTSPLMGDFGIFTKSEESLRELLMKITETEKPRIVTPRIYSDISKGQSTLYFSF